MNKEGDFLTLIKEIIPPTINHTITKYTVNQRYRIIFINDKGVCYLSNNDTPENMKTYSEQVLNGKITEEEKIKKIKKTCSIWLPNQLDEYFINIQEVRKEKIANIKKKFKC